MRGHVTSWDEGEKAFQECVLHLCASEQSVARAAHHVPSASQDADRDVFDMGMTQEVFLRGAGLSSEGA